MNTTIAMMQPYWFPYLGYYQLIAGADVFVLGDDLQYVKDGWINRNRVLCGGKPWLFSLPLARDVHGLAINQRRLASTAAGNLESLLKTLALHYARAPQRAQVMPLLERLMRYPDADLARYLEHSLREVCAYLGIHTPILLASELGIEDVVDKQDRVIKTMHRLGGNRYVNPIGGRELYEESRFRQAGLSLRFHQMNDIRYTQFNQPFVSHLSIIDVLMFNPVEQIRQWLDHYSLLLPTPQPTARTATPDTMASLAPRAPLSLS
jgi:hypothetical protein